MKNVDFEVIVGNIGTVYRGSNHFEANAKFNIYVGQSKRKYGRASNEPVTMLCNNDIYKEFIPPTDVEED